MNVELITQPQFIEVKNQSVPEFLLEDGSITSVTSAGPSILVDSNTIDILVDIQPGLPAGGLTGQVLAKKSNVAFDAEWIPFTKITVGPTAPPSPVIGELWVDTN